MHLRFFIVLFQAIARSSCSAVIPESIFLMRRYNSAAVVSDPRWFSEYARSRTYPAAPNMGHLGEFAFGYIYATPLTEASVLSSSMQRALQHVEASVKSELRRDVLQARDMVFDVLYSKQAETDFPTVSRMKEKISSLKFKSIARDIVAAEYVHGANMVLGKMQLAERPLSDEERLFREQLALKLYELALEQSADPIEKKPAVVSGMVPPSSSGVVIPVERALEVSESAATRAFDALSAVWDRDYKIEFLIFKHAILMSMNPQDLFTQILGQKELYTPRNEALWAISAWLRCEDSGDLRSMLEQIVTSASTKPVLQQQQVHVPFLKFTISMK